MSKENKLYITVGLPRSGKSYFAIHQDMPVVNPDAIRLALHGQRFRMESEAFVWALTRLMVDSLFGAGHKSVILDATNTTAERRDAWKSDNWKRVYVVIDVAAEVCKDRARGDAEILPIIDKMKHDLEFDGIFYGETVLNPDKPDMMVNHIEFPGRNENQIFHVGTAND